MNLPEDKEKVREREEFGRVPIQLSVLLNRFREDVEYRDAEVDSSTEGDAIVQCDWVRVVSLAEK